MFWEVTELVILVERKDSNQQASVALSTAGVFHEPLYSVDSIQQSVPPCCLVSEIALLGKTLRGRKTAQIQYWLKKNYTNLISLPIASNLVFTSLALHKHEWKKTGFPNHLIKNWDYDKDTSPSTLDGIFIPSSFLWAIHCCEIFFLHFLVFPELHTNQ